MKKPVISNNRPINVQLTKGKKYHFCRCGRSRNQPYCDGTHQTFSDDQVGHEGPGVRKNEDAAPEPKATAEEPALELIHHLARQGLQGFGHLRRFQNECQPRRARH